MSIDTEYNLENFYKFVEEKLRTGNSGISPEEALEQWRKHLATVESLQRGLDDVESGNTRLAREAIKDLKDRLS